MTEYHLYVVIVAYFAALIISILMLTLDKREARKAREEVARYLRDERIKREIAKAREALDLQ